MSYEKKDVDEMKKTLVNKEKVWQAINWELDENELNRIIYYDYRYEKDDYYDFEIIIGKVSALMNDEKSISYFDSWCILLMRCFMKYMKCRSSKLLKIFYDLGDYFDGVAFMNTTLVGKEKLKNCREIIAELKYYDHRICDLKNKTVTDFTTNNVITYVSFLFSLHNGKERLYLVCTVDKLRYTINYFITPEFEYSESINYTFLSEADFDYLPEKYWEHYALDTSMTTEYALQPNRRKTDYDNR